MAATDKFRSEYFGINKSHGSGMNLEMTCGSGTGYYLLLCNVKSKTAKSTVLVHSLTTHTHLVPVHFILNNLLVEIVHNIKA